MKIAIASDHAGYLYKEKIKIFLAGAGHEVVDFGTNSTTSVDYPDFIHPAAEAVSSGECERGIVLGGSGNGEAIAANKSYEVRCAVCWSEQTAKWAREHNDANMISIGERTVDEALAILIVKTWLETPFEGGRHVARIEKIENF